MYLYIFIFFSSFNFNQSKWKEINFCSCPTTFFYYSGEESIVIVKKIDVEILIDFHVWRSQESEKVFFKQMTCVLCTLWRLLETKVQAGLRWISGFNLILYFLGGAITQAKGALSSWWSNLTTNTPAESGALPPGQTNTVVVTEEASGNGAPSPAPNPDAPTSGSTHSS